MAVQRNAVINIDNLVKLVAMQAGLAMLAVLDHNQGEAGIKILIGSCQ
jgi:hypothetical protein